MRAIIRWLLLWIESSSQLVFVVLRLKLTNPAE